MQIFIFRFQIGYIRQNGMPDERPVLQLFRRQGIPYVDHRTVFSDKAVLTDESLLLFYNLLKKVGILFTVCRVHQLQIEIGAVIKQLAFIDA